VLRPLEGGSSSVSRTNHTSKLAALRVVRTFASEPQVLVDIFVNYDCDVCGENLYERTVGALANTMAPGAGEQQKFRDGAVQCVLALVRSLRAWHARGDVGVDDGDGVINSSSETAANAVTDSATATSAGARDKTESDRFAYMKHRKASLESATHGFNTRPNVVTLARVMEFSVTDDNASSSTGESSATASNRTSIDTAHSSFPERAALFLRQRGGGDFGKNGTGSKTKARTLDPGSVGALLGSDDVDSLAVMRAFAETFAFSGSTFDAALRLFVSPFRVPGEAQKIDRLMETFARRFCACNPGTFTHTDQAYVLAFAVVMLNTDAHNPKVSISQSPRSASLIAHTRLTLSFLSYQTDAAMKMTESAFVEMVMSGMVVEGKAGGGDTSTESDETSKETSKEPSTETSTETSKQAAAASSPPYASDESLRALYRRVVAVEIKMSPGHDELGGGDNDHDSDEDEKAFGSVEVVSVARANTLRAASAETEHVLRKTKALFGGDDDARGGGKQNSKFHAASEPGLSRPMLDTAGAPLTRAVSRAFLNAEDAAHAALPLEGTAVARFPNPASLFYRSW
jgi:guanine nucleotide-exchange factor